MQAGGLEKEPKTREGRGPRLRPRSRAVAGGWDTGGKTWSGADTGRERTSGAVRQRGVVHLLVRVEPDGHD